MPPVHDHTCRGTAETAWTVDPNLCLIRFATGVSRARGLAIAPNGDVFVNAGGAVTVLYDADGDGMSGTNERATFATAAGLNHGVRQRGERYHIDADDIGGARR